MTNLAKLSVLAILALAVAHGTAHGAPTGCCQPTVTNVVLCRMPVTKAYQIQPGFCPQQIACLLGQWAPVDWCCGGSYGQFGIQPIYTAGNHVLVRAMPDVHERVAKYLTDLGVYVAPKPSVDGRAQAGALSAAPRV